MQSKNFGKIESSLPLVSYGLSQLVAYLLFSTIGSYMKGRLIYGHIASCLLLSLLFVIWSFVETSFVVIMVFSAGIFFKILINASINFNFIISHFLIFPNKVTLQTLMC